MFRFILYIIICHIYDITVFCTTFLAVIHFNNCWTIKFFFSVILDGTIQIQNLSKVLCVVGADWLFIHASYSQQRWDAQGNKLGSTSFVLLHSSTFYSKPKQRAAALRETLGLNSHPDNNVCKMHREVSELLAKLCKWLISKDEWVQ